LNQYRDPTAPIMTLNTLIPDAPGDASQAAKVPAVSASVLYKSFGALTVLRGLTLAVNVGETLAVLGRSGTGKSVLLKLIIGLLQPDSGSVQVQGRDLAGLGLDSLSQVRRNVGFLFQHAALYDSLSVEQNVAFPLQYNRRDMPASERSGRVEALLNEVGMHDAIKKMPSELSGGMQKRVGLARALALDPSILLLDEPTAGLDPISSMEINDLVLKLQAEHHVASIVVTHDLHSAKMIANRLALLNEGAVVIEGTFADLEKSDIRFVEQFLRDS